MSPLRWEEADDLDCTSYYGVLTGTPSLAACASPHTCESYAYTFQLLFEFASNQHKVTPSKLYLEQIDAVLVMDFLAHIEATRDNGARTRNARLAAIKSFMRFVEHRVPSVLEQSLRILAIPSKKVDMPLIRYLSIAEMEAILNAPDLRTRSGIRDRAMLHLGFAAGLRVSELTGLLLTGVTLQPTRRSPSWAKGESSDLCLSGSRPLPTFVLGLQCGTKALRRNCSLMRVVGR